MCLSATVGQSALAPIPRSFCGAFGGKRHRVPRVPRILSQKAVYCLTKLSQDLSLGYSFTRYLSEIALAEAHHLLSAYPFFKKLQGSEVVHSLLHKLFSDRRSNMLTVTASDRIAQIAQATVQLIGICRR